MSEAATGNGAHGALGSKDMRAALRGALQRVASVRLGVVGDVMLDRFLVGFSQRVSREAPVVVLKHDHTLEVAGGAANTAVNARTLGAEVVVLGCVGEDAPASELKRLFCDAGIAPSHQRLHPVVDWPTTCKVRILGGLHHSTVQQLVRLDYEEPLDTLQAEAAADALAAQLREVWASLDACVISDYGLGVVCEPLLAEVRRLREARPIPVTVDAHLLRAPLFAGFTAATPNVAEVEATLAEPGLAEKPAQLAKRAVRLRETLGLEALLVTRGKYGMLLLDSLGETPEPLEIPVYGSDEVADVTGAGDTVIATYTAALATGATHEVAARLANVAGGLVVMKRGTATASLEEVQAALA